MYELTITPINPDAGDAGTAFFNVWLKENYPNNGSAFYFVGAAYTEGHVSVYLSEEPSAAVTTAIEDKYNGLAPPNPQPLSPSEKDVLAAKASGTILIDELRTGEQDGA